MHLEASQKADSPMASTSVPSSRFPPWLPLMTDCKLSVNKPFFPQVALGDSVYHSSRKLTQVRICLDHFEQTSLQVSVSVVIPECEGQSDEMHVAALGKVNASSWWPEGEDLERPTGCRNRKMVVSPPLYYLPVGKSLLFLVTAALLRAPKFPDPRGCPGLSSTLLPSCLHFWH